MSAPYSARVRDFLQDDPQQIVQKLCLDQARSFRTNEPQQIRAWEDTIVLLRRVLTALHEAAEWRLILEFPIRRLGRRIDAMLITPRGPLVLEFKIGADAHTNADRRQVEDYALDLQDFHAASRHHPIVPILIATRARSMPVYWPLLMSGAAEPIDANAADLGGILDDLWQRMPKPFQALDVDAWEHAPYRPVPGIIDAACTLYSHHGVADIAAARADAVNLTTTTDAILNAVKTAKTERRHIALFITGIPGAGKTLCGLNAVFGTGRDANAVFLTGNPSLVHVLREALARDAARGDRNAMRAARQRTKASIQALPAFRDHYVRNTEIPPENVAVIDKAQRAWSRAHVIRKSMDRPVRLSDSEPAHLLEILGRHEDWAVVVCLIGNGQEIHDGEGGLAEWGLALQGQPKWKVLAAPGTITATDPRQRLSDLADLTTLAELHLDVPMRSLRNSVAAPWVDAVLEGRVAHARHLAETRGPVPFLITRDLSTMRAHLRMEARGNRRAGLVASSGAKRLRAEGLGSEVPHMDSGAVARWFLDHWPEDVRASDALEQVATEFSCQGLELDHVGLCWGGDLIRAAAWLVRDFTGTKWHLPRAPEAIANRINTYRVLLTRARYETVIWVPRGDAADVTRRPEELDRVVAYLMACGTPLLTPAAAVQSELCREALLL